MQDRVSLYPGRVKLVPVAGQENTYDMVRADSPTQEGTPLNKDSLLKDATAALYGLGADAVPDDALAMLSRFHNGLGNEYVWEKKGEFPEEYIDVSPNITQVEVFYSPALTSNVTVYYSNSVSISNGTIVLDSPSSFIISNGNNVTTSLVSKYFYTSNDSTIYFGYQTNSMNAYSYYMDSYEVTVGYNTVLKTICYVNSHDPNAYPPAVSDGYTYTALGQLGSKLRIETGSYTGTGTYGDSNPNSLTFGFEPKLVVVFQDTTSSSNNGFFGRLIMINGAGNASFGAGSNYYLTTMFNVTSVKWYSANAALLQLNYSNGRYVYVAIG